MPVDTFLKIDGIPGESSDPKYKNWIEVLSFSWMIERKVVPDFRSAEARGGCRTDPFTVVKKIDTATPLLFNAVVNNKSLELKIELCRASGSDRVTYMEYTFEDCRIISIKTNLQSELPFEELGFIFRKSTMTYIQQKRADGTPGGNISAANSWEN